MSTFDTKQLWFPGSPFTCNLFDTSSVHIDWESVRTVPVLKPASFIVTLSSGSAAAVSVKITGE